MNAKLNKEGKRDEYLPTMTSIFTITRWFGVPVYGGKSFLLLTVIILLMLISIEVMAIWKLIRAVAGFAVKNGDEFSNFLIRIVKCGGVTTRLAGAIFYANTLISLLLIWRLLRTWKSLSAHWLRVESKGFYLQPDNNIRKIIFFVTWFVTICACVEHGLSMVSATGFNFPSSEWFSRYILNSHGFILLPNEYNLWAAIPVFITSMVATIFWNLQDLIVILLSMGLTSRYHRLNTHVERFVAYEKSLRRKSNSSLSMRINTWRNLRQAYVEQAELVRKVDKELGGLTILCNLNNFFFICLQLFLILEKSDGALSITYYIVSLAWLIFRASSVVLAAADVNLHSKRALASIDKCPSYGYNIEIKRLKYYLTNDYVCLTGLGIFFMNRQTLLEVAAAIVKYELILINFDT